MAVMKNKQLSMGKGKAIPTGSSGKMLKGQKTGQQKPGVTSQEHTPSGKGPVKGGNTKMFGKQTVKPVKKS